MTRKSKKLKESIAIVCEGSETENHYFDALIKKFSYPGDILIVPTPKEQDAPKPAATSRPPRKLKGGAPTKCYITQEEDLQPDYDQYKAQPTRYVREAYLLKENEGYTEAWAVFDKDQHTNHVQAFGCATAWDVHIALSCLSFEVWILAHFEKPQHAHTKVACKDADGKTISCDSQTGCKGQGCLCGYIRVTHDAQYSKNNRETFERLEARMEKAYVHAACLRYETKKRAQAPYESDLYTDVDQLVKRLLQDSREIIWVGVGEGFAFQGTEMEVRNLDGSQIQLYNKGNKAIILTDTISCSDETYVAAEDIDYIKFSPPLLEPEREIVVALSGRYLHLHDGSKKYIMPLFE